MLGCDNCRTLVLRCGMAALIGLASASLTFGEGVDGQKHVLVFLGQWRTLPINVLVEQKLHAALDPAGRAMCSSTGSLSIKTD
jgi:hypothetical protein